MHLHSHNGECLVPHRMSTAQVYFFRHHAALLAMLQKCAELQMGCDALSRDFMVAMTTTKKKLAS